MILTENELNSQNLEEFEELLGIFQSLQVCRFIEIGSLYGWSLRHFIHYSRKGGTAISIDLPVREFVGPNDWRVDRQESLQQNEWPVWAKENDCSLYLIPASSTHPKTIELTKKILKDELVDFLFIDGSHTYDAVKYDFETYLPLVRKGGIVAFHDIGEKEEGDVSKLWTELKTSHKTQDILKDSSEEKGIGVLYV